MSSRIQNYIATSLDITQASPLDVSRIDALQALNHIYEPKVIVWWQPKADHKIHYLAVFETADAAKAALDKKHDDWAAAPLSAAGKRALGASLEKTIKLYPNTFRRSRSRKTASGQPLDVAPPQTYQATSTTEFDLPSLAPTPMLPSQLPPVPATFPAPQIAPPSVAAATATPNTINAVADQANAVDKAIRALISQKDLVLQQRNELLVRTRELEQALTSTQEEVDGLKGRLAHQEKENERLKTIIASRPPRPVTRDVAVDASRQDSEVIPSSVVKELKGLCLALAQKDMFLAEKEKALQEMSRSLEEEVTKRKIAEGERDDLIAKRDHERARIPAVIDLFAELEKIAYESLKRENKDKGNEVR
ncbi:hypothetical protein FRC04_003071 [Tulasnella sp. 424]|nr:hypothetical protein FRC04_003071 [Tulasnella sp. 424]KAG8981138.1 hypothetical protein FRC05_004038 [Tulasnella sp. 425]